jgi:hypothetical protein
MSSLVVDRRDSVQLALPTRRGRRRPWARRLLAGFAVVVMLTSVWCAAVAARPGNDPFVAKAADWLRDHHLEAVANLVEHEWYVRQQPPIGGAPSRAIEAVPSAGSVDPSTSGAFSALPSPVTPFASPPLANEGDWNPIGPTINGHPAMAEAQLRPDSVHTSVLGALVWIDPKLVRLVEVPGTVEPGGSWPIIGTLPPDQRGAWIAAFNGGFRFRDAAGGFFAQGREAVPLVDGSASLVIRTNGTVDVGMWGRDDHMDTNVVSVRQNLELILDRGQPVPGIDQNDHHRWGRTLGNKVFVWRSGVGVRPDGTLIYGASNGLTVGTLASMLQAAGCVRAMELDINPEWVTFNLFTHQDPDATTLTASKLLPDMQRPAERFLGPDSRDFVAILAR